jgi:hypothetical protein
MTAVEAKKPKPEPAAQWQVAIPEVPGDPAGDSWNLTGDCNDCSTDENGRVIFEDQGSGGPVRVALTRSRVGGQLSYHFHLLFYPGTLGRGVVIDGAELGSFVITDGETPDRFPDRQECSFSPSMECFLNGTHPHANYDFEIQVGTLDDVERLEIGGVARGRIHLIMWDHWDENGEFHRLHCESDPRVIPIKRTGTDEWTISNFSDDWNPSNDGNILHCEEYYVTVVPRPGKKDDPKMKSEERVVMTADTLDLFVFEAIWTRE